MIKHISIVMIVKNGEKTIRKALQSLEEFQEVIVYDNGSVDKTIDIVKEFENVKLIQGEFLGFGKTKKKATEYAKNDWVLILDADEVIDETLRDILKHKKLDDQYIYSLNSNAYYKDTQVKYCGWSNHKTQRVFNKKITNFDDSEIHESIIDTGLKNEVLGGNISHYSYSSISEFLQKTDKYSKYFADENVGKKSASPSKAFFRAFYFFIKNYIFRLGFLDGYVGLLVCVSGANGVFYKYLKLYERNNNL